MSGPKTSSYTLTAEQRSILARQRLLEQRKAVERENLKQGLKNIRFYKKSFSQELTVAEELKNQNLTDNGIVQKIDELSLIIGEIVQAIHETDKNNLTAMKSCQRDIQSVLKKAEILNNKIQILAQKNAHQLHQEVAVSIDEGFSSSFSVWETENDDEADNAEAEIKRYKTMLMAKTDKYSQDERLSEPLKKKFSFVCQQIQNINDLSFLKNFNTITIVPLVKRAEQEQEYYNNHYEEYERLSAEYEALCNLYHHTVLYQAFSAESVAFLQEEIRQIKAEAEKREEQNYICQSLDEVMEEMGYSVIGSREVRKRNGRYFRSELYTYGEGMAVNITHSSDGRIAMELGGLDNTDRIPNTAETEVLCEEMEKFCEDFTEIERRLLAKGIIAKERIALLPPDAAYAQIINANDYDTEFSQGYISERRNKQKTTEIQKRKME